MLGVRREAAAIVMLYGNAGFPSNWNIWEYLAEMESICHASRIISERTACFVSCATERLRGKQSIRTPRSAARWAARQAERGDEAIGGTKNGTTAIKQSSRVMYGGLGGARTRVLQLAKLLLPRLSY